VRAYDLRPRTGNARSQSADAQTDRAMGCDTDKDNDERFALRLSVEGYNTEGFIPADLWNEGVVLATIRVITGEEVTRVLLLERGVAILFFGTEAHGYGLPEEHADCLAHDLTRPYNWLGNPVNLSAEPILEKDACLQLKKEGSKRRSRGENRSNSANTAFYDDSDATYVGGGSNRRAHRRRQPKGHRGGGPSDPEDPSDSGTGYTSGFSQRSRRSDGSTTESGTARSGKPTKNCSRTRLIRKTPPLGDFSGDSTSKTTYIYWKTQMLALDGRYEVSAIREALHKSLSGDASSAYLLLANSDEGQDERTFVRRLLKHFDSYFGAQGDYGSLKMELDSAKQRHGESVNGYASRLANYIATLKLCHPKERERNAVLNERDMCSRFYEGLTAEIKTALRPEYRIAGLRKNYIKLLKAAREIEKENEAAQKRRNYYKDSKDNRKVYVRNASVTQTTGMVRPADDQDEGENSSGEEKVGKGVPELSDEVWEEVCARVAQLQERPRPTTKMGDKKRGCCYCCGSPDHLVRDCPLIAEAQKNVKAQEAKKKSLPAKSAVQKTKTSQASVEKAFKLVAKALTLKSEQEEQSDQEESAAQKENQKE